MGYNRWVSQSIMNRRRSAAGKTGKTHRLTEEQQTEFYFTIGPYSKPVLYVNPGDRIVVDTRDAFSGRIKTEADKPSEKTRQPFANPQNGPIIIEGAAPGDAAGRPYRRDAAAIPAIRRHRSQQDLPSCPGT